MSAREALDWAARLTDDLNRPLDYGITLFVAGLHRYGIATVQSCEGHLDRGWGPAPWVEIAPRSVRRTWLLLRELPELSGFHLVPMDGADVPRGTKRLCPRVFVTDDAGYRRGSLLYRPVQRPTPGEGQLAELLTLHQSRALAAGQRLLQDDLVVAM
jgi:hypothetical protein